MELVFNRGVDLGCGWAFLLSLGEINPSEINLGGKKNGAGNRDMAPKQPGNLQGTANGFERARGR